MTENAKKRGRPRKVASPDMDVEKLKEALTNALRTIDALQSANKYSEKPVVVVRHSGYGPQLIIPIDGESSVVLDPNGPKSRATIPLSDYLYVEQNLPWVREGYLYQENQKSSNPNLITDLKEWFDSRNESELVESVNVITSEGALNFLYNFTEDTAQASRKAGQPTPSKVLFLRGVVTSRMEQLFDLIFVEDSYEED